MNLFSYIKSRISILDVISEYTQLKKAGTYWKGNCPFHSEKTASFSVSPHKEIFYCFGCHIGGDAISFVAKAENCSPLEAAFHLADRHSIDLPQELKEQHHEPTRTEKKHYYDLCTIVALWCHQQLNKSPAALHYLLKRGLNKDIMRHFTVGYFPGGQTNIKELATLLLKHGFLVKDLLDAGILQEGKTMLYSSFEERIIFPIKDHLGRFCGFGGRIFKSQDERPKYYNSRENPFFNKGSLLFGLDHAKKSMQQQDYAFLVEGYTDCLAMVQYGYPNTVATLGTACTPEHLKILARYTNQLYVVYDGDRAGKEAIVRLTALCWQASLELKVICLPAQEDPASFLTNGNDLTKLIQQAQDIFIFFIEHLAQGFAIKPMAEKLQLTRKLLSVINTVEDTISQDLLLQRAAKTVEIPFESLKKELEKINKTSSAHQKTEEKVNIKSPEIKAQTIGSDQKLEKNLFFAIINNVENYKSDNQEYLSEYLPAPLNVILKKLHEQKAISPSLDFVQFFDSLDSYEKEFVSKILLEFEGPIEPGVVDQLLAQFHRKNWKSIVHTIKIQLDHAKRVGNLQEEQKILQHFLELKNKLSALNLL